VYRIFVGGASVAAVDFARGIGGFWGNQSDLERFLLREGAGCLAVMGLGWNWLMESGVFSSEDCGGGRCGLRT
jgi:hypothetical protein